MGTPGRRVFTPLKPVQSEHSLLTDEQREALSAVRRAAQAQVDAREAYKLAIVHGKDLGLSNNALAMAGGVTEGGIRMLLKREFG